MKKIINAFHCLSIKKKLILSFSVLVIMPVLISLIFSNSIIGGILLEKISKTNMDSNNSASKRIDRLLDDVTFTLLSMSRNLELINVLKSDTEDGSREPDTATVDTMKKHKTINSILDNIPIAMLMYSSNITVLSGNDVSYGNWEDFYKYSGLFRQKKWYIDLMEGYSGNILWIGANKSVRENSGNDSFVIEAAIPVKERGNIFKSIGVIHIGIPEKFVYDVLKTDDLQDDIFLIDSNNAILSFKDKSVINAPLAQTIHVYNDKLHQVKDGWYIEKTNQNRKIVISVSSVSRAGWKVITVTPYDRMLAPLTYVRNILVIINILSVVSFLSVALIISNNISNPIIKLNEKMKEVEKGNLDERVEVVYNDEIGHLGMNFNNMLDRVCELIKLNKMQERLKREAEFNALQAQINPHFLFNTLSSIRWAAAANKDKKVEDMVFALSSLLRISISKGPDMIRLEEEITFLRHYVTLCRMRQGLQFDFVCDLAPELLQIKIPRFILQPIVENAIIHGFEGKKQGGRILIKGFMDNENIKIEISDNGKGMDPFVLDEILSDKTRERNKNKYFNSIGIKNVEERIKLNYGVNYGLKIRNCEMGGTVVTLILPCSREEFSGVESFTGG